MSDHTTVERTSLLSEQARVSYGTGGKAVSLVSVAQRGFWLSDRHVRAFVEEKKKKRKPSRACPQVWGSHQVTDLKLNSCKLMLLLTTTKSLQSCPTLCDPTDGSPPGSPAPGILQARTLEWVAIAFSNA